ncbi:MAG TPA: N-acetyl-D-Glu racemase DgcA [Micropepsaceae bacterium]|jgi:L-alanine-DL-glutamate epimerase-like enolase superfamily enzyme|nr:N-acetyl-D-Glu racemase DgcA [Micropepsaceae bacterium]
MTQLWAAAETWPIRGAFRIARGAKTSADIVVVTLSENGKAGRGECVPYGRYGETVASVLAQIESQRLEIERGLSRTVLQDCLPAGAARNAIDCALIDLEAKKTGQPAHRLLGLPPPRPVRTAYTLSLDSPQAMGAAAAEAAGKGYGLLKLKIAGEDDIARVEAVRRNAPDARLIVDANEGWNRDALIQFAPALAHLGVALIEQPLKAAEDDILAGYDSPVPLCADESCHTRADLPRLKTRYTHINVKLDKAGGLTEAAALVRAAQSIGLKVMVGCMVSTSLAMAPASLLASQAAFADLDGPLLLARDREPAMHYEGDILYPPESALWG